MSSTYFIATRGSTLALAQANQVLAQLRKSFPEFNFEIKIIKTTGDKLQTVSLANESKSLPKGLFTKELEVALLDKSADFAVHSLKDLPTELPDSLELGAVGEREDVRDVLIYRSTGKSLNVSDLSKGATVGTGSTRRKSQLLTQRPDLNIIEHRGNVLTRIEKLANRAEIEAIVLAAAGLSRLDFKIDTAGVLSGPGVPSGLSATFLNVETMLPCVGQGAIGIETRSHDERVAAICRKLTHQPTLQCVTAERSFLNAMGGGCQSPIAAYAQILSGEIHMHAVSFRDHEVKHGQLSGPIDKAVTLGKQMADKLK